LEADEVTAKKTPALRDWREQRNNRRVSIDDERRRAQKAEFIRALKITGAVRQTCDALGVSRASIYRWKEDDEQFREQWIEARFSAKDNLI
jgi:predicted transcriptional regulator YheO